MSAAATGAGPGAHNRALGPAFWKVWWASTTANLGDGIRIAALPLLAVSVTRDAFLVSLVVAAGSLPWLVVGLFAGALVDRWDRVRILWVVNAVRAATMLLLVVSILTGSVSIWLLVLVAVVIGTGETFVDNAAQAVLPRFVPPESLERANGRLYGGQVVTGQFLGRGLSGLLFGAGAAAPFMVDAVMLAAASLFGLVLATSLPRSTSATGHVGRPARPARPMLPEIREGIAWLWRHRLLRKLWLVLAALGFASGAFWGVVALYAVEVLRLTPVQYGFMLAVGATGSLLGSLTAATVRYRLGTTRALHLATGLVLTAGTGLALTSSGVVAALLMVTNGFGVLLWNVVMVSMRQRLTPPHLLGRVNAAFSLIAVGATSIGALAGGLTGQLISLPAVFWLSTALLGTTVLAVGRLGPAPEGGLS